MNNAMIESVAGTSTVQVALTAAVESGDLNMLRAAIERARDVHFPLANPQYMKAQQMLVSHAHTQRSAACLCHAMTHTDTIVVSHVVNQ
jgi:hypothetical protein